MSKNDFSIQEVFGGGLTEVAPVSELRVDGKKDEKLKKVLYPSILLAVLIVLWEVCVLAFGMPQTVLPSPFSVARALAVNFKSLILPELIFTLEIIAAGYTISVLAGFLLAALCSQSRLLARSAAPLAVMFMVTPTIILIPIFMVFLGFSPIVRIIVVVLQCVPIIMLNTLTGFMSIEPQQREMLAAHGCSRRQILTKFTIFNAMPQIFTGLKIGCVISTIAALGADFAMGKEGLGYRIKISSSMVAIDMVFATIIVAALVGIVMFEIVSFIERRVIVWKRGG
ncbi:MAG: ABC transporter permease [Synergistaceae bacterium]|nr:ABC transporter permease [Synergistaceae bacterium]